MTIKNDFGKIDIDKLEEIIDYLNKRDQEREKEMIEMEDLKKRMDKIEAGLYKNPESPFVEEEEVPKEIKKVIKETKPKKGKK